MADIKISQLNSLSSADLKDSDVLVINDVSVSTTKQITREAFLDGFTRNIVDSGTGAKIAGDFTVDNELTVGGDLETTGKITFGSLQDHAEGIFISKFVDAADAIVNNLTDSSIPTSLAVRDYVALQTASNIAGLLNVDSAGAQTVLYPVMVKDPDGDEDSALTDPDLSYNANTRTLTSGNLVPLADSEYNLGSASKKWKELFISGSTINIGNKKIQIDNDKVNFVGATGFQLDGVDFSGGGAANPVATARLLPTGGQVIRYDSTGSVELGGDQSLTFKGIVGGFNGDRTFKFFVDDVEKSSQTVSIDSATYTMLDGDEPAANASKTVKLLVTGSGDSEASDFVSVFGVKDGGSGTDGTDGDDGDDGVSSVTTFLTNEVHTVAADSAGVLSGDLTSAGGTMKVFVGATDVTGNADVTYSNPSEDGISASIASTGIYTISSFDSDGATQGIATFRAVVAQSLIQGASGDVTVEKQYSIAKQLGGGGLDGADGAAGEDARAVKIIANDGQVVRYDSSGSEADTLTFTAQPENQDTGTEVTYRWSVRSPGASYVVKKNSGSVDYTLADADEPSIDGVKIVKCEMYEDSVEKAQDTMTLYGLVNGFSVTGFLSNETHVEPSDSVGALTTSLSDAGGTFKVFLGTTDITTSSSVSYSNTANTGINVTIDAGGDGGASSGQYTINSFSSNATLTGTADFRATVAQALIPGASGDFIIDKKYSIAKARQGVTGEGVGVPGADGTDARAVKLIPNDGQVIRYDADGTTETDTLTFTADNNDAFTGTETWQFLLKKGGGASYVAKKNSGSTAFTLADGDEPSVDSAYTLQVKAFEDSAEKANDFVTIYGLQNGTGITAFLTNESHVEAYDSGGALVDDLTDAGGTFKVFRGTTEITTNCTFSVQSETGVDVSINSGSGVYTVNSISADKGNADFQVSVPATLVPGGSAAMLIDKTYSIAKSRSGASGSDGGNGADGDDARAVKLIPTAGQVVRYDADGSTETDTLTFSADNNDAFSGTETWQFRLDKGSGSFVEKQSASATSTFTLPDADEPGVDSSYIVQVRAFEDATLKATDQVSVFGLQNGAGITAFLTNESHVEGYDSNGALVDNFSDAGGTFKVFRGTTDITTNCTFSKQSQSNMTSAINSGTGVYSVSALTAKNGNSVFRATVPQAQVPGGGSDMTIDKTYTISKSQDGGSGDDGGDGSRGPGRWHIDCDSISYAAAGETDNTVPTTATGAAEAWDEGSFVGTSPGAEVAGDQAWFFQGTIANPTAQKVWIYNGSAWAEQTEAIDGSLLVSGTVTASGFQTDGIVDSTASTGRTTIKNSGIVIESWETNQMVVRVKIGDLS